MKTRRILGLAIIGLTMALIALWRIMKRLSPGPARKVTSQTLPDLQQFSGLSEEEATLRRPVTTDQAEAQAARQVRREIWRTNTFSVFNFNMLGLATAQALLGDLLGAILTFIVFLLNVGLNAAQQLYATKRVERLFDQARPQPTVIREGQIRSARLEEVVVGDVLVAGPGDQFLVDGLVLSGKPMVSAPQSDQKSVQTTIKRAGDRVPAGAYCLQGRAIYQVVALPAVVGRRKWSPIPGTDAALTPLQRIMVRVLRIMMVLILFFLGLLILDMANLPVISELFEGVYREAAAGFFSIAPSSLFFMIVATYALGSARLGELGALVRDSRAVEALAQISVICFSQTGILTGAEVQFEMIPGGENGSALAESRVRQILGDLAHSVPNNNVFLQAIAQHLPGSNRPVAEAAAYLSAYGWMAITLLEADVRGTYVLGEPQLLEPCLASATTPAEPEDEPEPASFVQKNIERVNNLFKRFRDDEDDVQDAHGEDERIERPGEGEPEHIPHLLFAYLPEPAILHDADGLALLPTSLVPLCTLRFGEDIRPEAVAAIQAFRVAGVQVKILASDDPRPVLRTARQLGISEEGPADEIVVSGAMLSRMRPDVWQETIQETALFAQLTSVQKGQIVQALRHQGERVAMVGDAAYDIPAMEKADLRITLRSSSQANLSIADVVLWEDSFQVIPTILERGQQLVNGMLDILKINLAQIGYVLLLTIAMFLSGRRIFYYHPTQGGIIAFFTIIVPSLGLTFWASSGRLPPRFMRSRLWHFVIPAAITMALAALVTTWIFDPQAQDLAYAQMAVTHLLVVVGLVLVIFVQPPTRFWVGGDELSKDWRNTYAAIVLFLLFIVMTALPLTQELFRLNTLQDGRAYVLLGVLSIGWLFIVRAIWRAPWLSRYVGVLSDRLERS